MQECYIDAILIISEFIVFSFNDQSLSIFQKGISTFYWIPVFTGMTPTSLSFQRKLESTNFQPLTI